MTTKKEQAAKLAERTEDAYSSNRFASWKAVAAALLRDGCTERQAEAIMRSKWARWACDRHAGEYRYGEFPAKVLTEYASRQGKLEILKLTQDTFGDDEELVGE